MYIPRLLKRGNKEYILEKVYPNYALYCDLDCGYKECFGFHELGMIEEVEENRRREAKRGGMIKI